MKVQESRLYWKFIKDTEVFPRKGMALTNKREITRVKKNGVGVINWKEIHWELFG